jgi:Fe-S-cluster containining protein
MDPTQKNNGLEEFFEADGYRTAASFAGQHPDKKRITQLYQKIFEYSNEITGLFLDQCRINIATVSCRKGCAWCCHQSVMILPGEAMVLAEWIKNSCNEPEREEIIQRLKKRNQITSCMKAPEFIHFKMACAFLSEDSCSVYPVRPLSCRSFISSSESSCREEFYDPYNLNLFPKLYELPLQVSRNLNKGISAYLEEQGLLPFEWLMESMVLTALDPNASEEWLHGQDRFRPRDVDEQEFHYINTFEKK